MRCIEPEQTRRSLFGCLVVKGYRDDSAQHAKGKYEEQYSFPIWQAKTLVNERGRQRSKMGLRMKFKMFRAREMAKEKSHQTHIYPYTQAIYAYAQTHTKNQNRNLTKQTASSTKRQRIIISNCCVFIVFSPVLCNFVFFHNMFFVFGCTPVQSYYSDAISFLPTIIFG